MATALSAFTFTAQAAFDTGPLSSSPLTWTDVTSDVLASEGMTFTRGRSDVYAKPGPGTGDVVMRNWAEGSKVAGRWTPGVAAGPWHPLKLKRRFRVRVTYSGTTYDVWSGHITDYAPSWPSGSLPTCALALSDLYAALAGVRLRALLEAEQLADSPAYLFSLADAAGSTTAADSVTAGNYLTVRQVGTAGGAVDFAAGEIGPDETTAAAFTPVDTLNGKALYGTIAGVYSTGLTLEAVVRKGAAAAANETFVMLLDPTKASTSPSLWWTSTDTIGSDPGASGACDRETFYHVACSYEEVLGTTRQRLYVNGTLVASDDYGATGITPTQLWIGANPTLKSGATTFDGNVAAVAVYGSALSAARIAAHASAMTGFAGETTDARFDRLAAAGGLASALYSSPTAGLGTMGAQPTKDKPLTTALDEVTDVEQGLVAVSAAGVLTFHPRQERYNATAAVTLDARTDILGGFDGLTYNDELVVNDVTVTRTNGATQRVKDATSITDYGTRSDSLEVNASTDTEAYEVGAHIVTTRATPTLKAPALRIAVGALAAAKVPGVLGLDVGSMVTVSNLPAGTPASSVDLFVEGIRDDIGPDGWTRTLTTSATSLTGGAAWVLGSGTYSVLGTSTIVAF